mmetsp:Transcript_34540/g.63119  ORF Transcript_34540/g.63119 Transcript_34540/m.63119 type:complete len:270 (+) Transcript_34540:1388-2197(+)
MAVSPSAPSFHAAVKSVKSFSPPRPSKAPQSGFGKPCTRPSSASSWKASIRMAPSSLALVVAALAVANPPHSFSASPSKPPSTGADTNAVLEAAPGCDEKSPQSPLSASFPPCCAKFVSKEGAHDSPASGTMGAFSCEGKEGAVPVGACEALLETKSSLPKAAQLSSSTAWAGGLGSTSAEPFQVNSSVVKASVSASKAPQFGLEGRPGEAFAPETCSLSTPLVHAAKPAGSTSSWNAFRALGAAPSLVSAAANPPHSSSVAASGGARL